MNLERGVVFVMLNDYGFVMLDGAMGTMLTEAGLKAGEKPEFLNIEAPEKVIDVHKKYIEAGSNIIYSNSFGVSSRKLIGERYTTEEVIRAAVKNAKIARGDREVRIALGLGSLGEMMEPMGTLTFEETYELYKEQVLIGADEGVDLVVIETITDLYELKAAILAVKENTRLPIITTMSFEDNGRTFSGCLPESFAITATGLGVSALGVNCSLGPDEIYPIIERVSKVTNLPLVVKANAGLPNFQGEYTMKSQEFAKSMAKIADLGVQYLGGCCGTRPEYIVELKKELEDRELKSRRVVKVSAVCSPVKYLELKGFIGVGEKINPTGKPYLKESLAKGNMDPIIREAISQSEGYCEILDVNVGTPEVDEVKTMREAVKTIQSVVDLPLQIDSSNLVAIESGLRVYNGKPVVNSVTGEFDKMEEFFPIIKKYGAAFIGLTLDENGISDNPIGRYRVAERIVKTAIEYGIPKEDIIIDCLALTVSAKEDSAMVAMETIDLVKERLGVKTILGVSNISFGLPGRDLINNSFLLMAIARGLDMGIINPTSPSTIDALRAYELLWGKDKGAEKYISSHKDNVQEEKPFENKDISVDYALSKGMEKELVDLTKALLREKSELEIIDSYLIPALDKVGISYEKGEIFLPQLIKSASTAQAAFEILKESIAKKGSENISKGDIILATVKGDIHDIGKNIVKVILENYGYNVIDLGKDVAIEKIVEVAKERNIRLIGLSALMTTTLKNMEDTINEIKKYDSQVKIMVGGAVLTGEYAKRIGADYYVSDASADVEIAKNIFGE